MNDAPAYAQQPTQVGNLTPMMEQYVSMKEKAEDALLFFRMGDFYELFYDDALVASKAMSITLTSRQKLNDDPIPMCGIPAHSADGYIDRLILQGFKVAICEQVEDPRQAKGLVKRDIIRIITPGTVLSGNTLDPKANNFLASIAVSPQGAGFAYVDVSTGAFAVTTWETPTWQQALCREYERVRPREVLLPTPASVTFEVIQQAAENLGAHVQAWEARHYRRDRAYQTLTKQFGVLSLAGFGCEDNDLAIAAAGALLTYVHETQQATMTHVNGLRVYHTDEFMILDQVTQANLELLQSPLASGRSGSLLDVIDQTVSAMGGRLLRQWLSQPLCRLPPLLERQEAVAELVEQPTLRARLRQHLERLADLERILGRLVVGSANPRELVALRRSLTMLPALQHDLQPCQGALLTTLTGEWDSLTDLETLVASALVDDAPATLREGRAIKPGYDAELDDLRDAGSSGKAWLSAFEMQERQRTGISSLRIGFNKVFGYYLEVRKSHQDQVPDDYQRKQTLVNAERYITPALKEREVRMLRAADEALQREHHLFDALRQQITAHSKRLQRQASILSQLDVLAALAEVAVARQYCRPRLDMGDTLSITEGRHPILEVTYDRERFVPNDTHLDRDTMQILLVTGPNMAGKSTYMRQVALVVVLAQIGSFVPAQEAHIGLVDRIFTRVGAQDLLAKGQSTFMVEMTETAHILHHVSARSLVLLDEIGRGTSTYDGMSIAWAVMEYLHNHDDLRPRTLFATHYHELTALASAYERIQNYNAAVREWGDKIIFLRKILPGSADRSYGIQVARLAGLPPSVLERARHLLAGFEAAAPPSTPTHGSPATSAPQLQLSLFDDLAAELLAELRALSLDTLSPLEALNTLADLQRKAQRLP